MSVTNSLNKSSSIPHFSKAAVAAVSMLAAGCSFSDINAIDGIDEDKSLGLPTPEEVAEKKAAELEFIPVEDVVTAVLEQMDGAFCELYNMQNFDKKNNPAVKGLVPKAGTGVLTGKMQLVNTASGGVAAVFPFGPPVLGSTLSPNIGGTQAGTGSQELSYSFSFTPPSFDKKEKDKACKNDGYVAKSWISAFSAIGNISSNQATGDISSDPGKNTSDKQPPSQTAIKSTQLKLTLTFSVAETADAGLGVKFLTSAIRWESVSTAPALGIQHKETGSNTLTITLPFVTANTGADSRRLIQGAANKKGRVIFIEEPYTDVRACQFGLRIPIEKDGKMEDDCPRILEKAKKPKVVFPGDFEKAEDQLPDLPGEPPSDFDFFYIPPEDRETEEFPLSIEPSYQFTY